jgi:hypothetical protein
MTTKEEEASLKSLDGTIRAEKETLQVPRLQNPALNTANSLVQDQVEDKDRAGVSKGAAGLVGTLHTLLLLCTAD